MSKKRIMFSAFIVLLILAFGVNTVGAQTSIPPLGEADAEPSFAPADGMQVPDISQFKMRFEDYVPSGDLVSADVTPFPISPQGEWIFNKTPKFYFYEYGGATKYRISVYNIVPSTPVLVYEFTGPPTCSSGICWLKPPTALKVYDITNTKGIYAWGVSAKDDGWIGYTGFVQFGVISKGFNSTFDANMNKWLTVSGNWARVDPGYLKSTGLYNAYTSVVQKDYVTDDYVFTVRMKGKTGANQYQGIVISGEPDPLSSGNVWYDGVYFLYCGGFSGVLVIRDGLQIYWSDWLADTSFDPTGWNILKLIMDSPNAYLVVNGLSSYKVIGAADLDPGYVGLVHVKYITDKAPLLVDWAKLSYPPPSAMAEIVSNMSGAMVINLDNLPPMVGGAGSLDPPK